MNENIEISTEAIENEIQSEIVSIIENTESEVEIPLQNLTTVEGTLSCEIAPSILLSINDNISLLMPLCIAFFGMIVVFSYIPKIIRRFTVL